MATESIKYVAPEVETKTKSKIKTKNHYLKETT